MTDIAAAVLPDPAAVLAAPVVPVPARGPDGLFLPRSAAPAGAGGGVSAWAVLGGVVGLIALGAVVVWLFRRTRKGPIRIPVDDSPGYVAGLDLPAPVTDPRPDPTPPANGSTEAGVGL